MINKVLLNHDVQKFINDNIHTDINKLILKGSHFQDINAKDLAEQIQSKKAIQKKLPLWFNTSNIIFPPKLNLEQSSSEQTAIYKSNLANGDSLIDLTGGFGIDDFYFSKKVKKVYHCELNEHLSDIAKHNAQVLNATNIQFLKGDSIQQLKNIDFVDTIYIDPSRRADANSRVFLFEDCLPNVIENLDLLLKKSNKIIIKAAPILDIDAAYHQLKNVSEIHVVSLQNECKELLFVITNEVKETELITVLIDKNKTETISFPYLEEKNLNINFGVPNNYLYEPDVAVLKAGLFKSVAKKFKVDKLHQHSHLYTSNLLVENFPGRVLQIENIEVFSHFAKKQKIKKANIITRNFNLKPDELKKKLKITDGGDIYLYFTTDIKNDKIVISAKRIK